MENKIDLEAIDEITNSADLDLYFQDLDIKKAAKELKEEELDDFNEDLFDCID